MRPARNRRSLAFSTRAAWGVSALTATVIVSACALDPNQVPGADDDGGSTAGGSAGTSGTGGAKGGTTGTSGSSSGGNPGKSGAGGTSAGGGGKAGSGTSGSSQTGGAAGSAGTQAEGGRGGTSTGGGGAFGGAGSGGKAPVAGEGGMSGGGTGGSSGGTGGGDAGSGGSGGKPEPDPSAGCGKAAGPTGTSGNPQMVSGHQYYVKLPSGYDGSKPYPVLFMFNPTGNPINWAEQNAGFESNGAKDAWIRVYPHPANSGNGWGSTDVPFFGPLYDTVTSNFCVDKARVFAAGESSGGDFSSILGCDYADKLRAVAPCATKDVGGFPLDPARRECTGQVASVVIHGKNDNVVGPANGPKTRDFYVALNHCTSMSEPVEGYTDALSNCVEYQGCDANFPVYWCLHTDPEYSNTNHGWPHFAAKFLFEKFSEY